MIGYPTGLGALVVKKEAAMELLESKTNPLIIVIKACWFWQTSRYFGGGTIEVSLSEERYRIQIKW